MPGLARSPARRRRRTCCAGAPVRAGCCWRPSRRAAATHDPVYGYLDTGSLRHEAEHELGRLLYVGATRARTRLHLVATAEIAVDRRTRRHGSRRARALGAGEAVAGVADCRPPPPVVGQDPPRRARSRSRRRRCASAGWIRRCPRSPGRRLSRRAAGAAAAASPPFEWAHADRRRRRHRDASLAGAARARGRCAAGTTSASPHCGPRIRIELAQRGRATTDKLDAAAADVDRALREAARRRARALAVRSGARRSRQRMGAGRRRRRRDRARHARPHASSPTACAGSSISRPAATRAATRRPFSTREVERYRAQLERYARIVRAHRSAADPARAVLPAGRGRLARMGSADASRAGDPPPCGQISIEMRYNSSLWLTCSPHNSACRAATQRAYLSRTSRPRRRPDRADDRQFRRRASRPPGDARRGSSKPRRTCACRPRC